MAKDKEYYQDEPITPDGDKRRGQQEPSHRPVDEADRQTSLWDFVEEPQKRVSRDDVRDFDQFNDLVTTPADNADDDVPARIRQYIKDRRAAKRTFKDSKERFYMDAVEMVDITDCAPMERFFPGEMVAYENMTLPQLRSYFTFRTNFRKGMYMTGVQEAYVRLLTNELLLLVGVKDAEEAWQALQVIVRVYAQNGIGIWSWYMIRGWMKDFVVYYDLSNHMDSVFAEEMRSDANTEKMLHIEDYDNAAIWEMLQELAPRDFSHCVKQVGDDELVKLSVVTMFQKAVDSYRRTDGLDIAKIISGELVCERVSLFYGAVFWKPAMVRKATVRINGVRSYICKYGSWYLQHYYVRDDSYARQLLATLMHETDRQLRIANHCAYKLKPKPLSVTLRHVVKKSIEEAVKTLVTAREQARRQVLVDMLRVEAANLSRIRADAAVTMEQLLNDEERGVGAAPPQATVSPSESDKRPFDTIKTTPAGKAEKTPTTSANLPQAPAATLPQDGMASLLPQERQFLLLLLDSEDWRAYLKNNHMMVSVTIESINDKLYDTFGDTVLQEEEGQPLLLEDYRDELAELLHV